MTPTHTFEVYYDGACPLCTKEIDMLRRMDRDQHVRFTDIAAADFDASELGVPWSTLMARIHGRSADGTLVEGVEVFRQLYAAVGYGGVVGVTRLPGISHALDLGYHLFAKNRLKLTGRCVDDTCAIDPGPTRASRA